MTDEAEKMLDRLAAHMWRTDMESAPRDDTPVLAGQFNKDAHYYGRTEVDTWCTESGSHGYTGFGNFNTTYWPATHWKPLDTPDADIAAAAHAALSGLIAENKRLREALDGLLPGLLCGESWNLPDSEKVSIIITFGALKAARAILAKGGSDAE